MSTLGCKIGRNAMFTLLLILMILINPTWNKFDHKLYHNKLNAHSLRYIMMVLNYRAQNELLQKTLFFNGIMDTNGIYYFD